MASLKKPKKCPQCLESDTLTKVVVNWTTPHYEGWYCDYCVSDVANAVWPRAFIVSRPKRNKNACRGCGRTREETPFSNHGNICKDCKSKYHTVYREENAVELKKKRDAYWARMDYGIRGERVRKAQTRSPEAFLRHLSIHIRKSSKRRRVEFKKLNPACLIVEIDYDFLLRLYHEQKGLCPFLKVPMKHEFNNLLTMSVDRIDSDKGYIPGNVQLVTQFIQGAKRHFSNDVVHVILNAYFDERVRRRLAGIENLQEACRKEALVELAAVDKEIVASLAKQEYDRSPGFESD